MVFKDARFRGEKRALVLPVIADLEARVAKALASAPNLDGSAITVHGHGRSDRPQGLRDDEIERQRAEEQTS